MIIVLEDCARLKFLIRYGLSILAVLFLIASCTTTAKQSDTPPTLKTGSHADAKGHFDDHEIEKRLREEYRRWIGTRHRLGGTSKQGIDCSGFVQSVYKNIFKIRLPRTTKAQVRQGQPISSINLQAGDLVFFKPPTYPRHVGIFLSKSEFVHASKKKGVTISKIDGHYWGKYYWTARRILPISEYP